MAIISFFPPRLTALGSFVDATIRTSHGAAETILDYRGAGTIGNGRARAVNACDHCGRRFGMVTYRWWGSKFCKKTCKAAFLRELWLGCSELRVDWSWVNPLVDLIAKDPSWFRKLSRELP
jgi:hypothetical protein